MALEDAGRRASGRQFGVHVSVRIPGREIVVTRSHDADIYVALSDAFDIVRRQLLEASGRRLGRPRRAIEHEHEKAARSAPTAVPG